MDLIYSFQIIYSGYPVMDRPIPLPSHIHYELLLRLLERETAAAIYQHSPQKKQLQELIITLRKAMSQQKQLEESCRVSGLPVEYHWSLNEKPDS